MYKIAWITLLIGLVGLGAASGRSLQGETPYSRTITKTFQVGNASVLTLDNKYGKLNLTTWDKNEIRAVITITTHAANAEDAQALAEQVHVRAVQSSPGSVSLSTSYEGSSKGGSFWKQFFGGSAASSSRSVHIDYEVTVPRSLASMNLRNSYGDVGGSDLPGNVSLALSYGHFYLSRIAGKLDLNANYSGGTLTEISGGVITGNYSDFQFDHVKNVKIHSNYSNFKVSRGARIDLHANYGSFTAQELAGLHAESNYTDFKIDVLDGQSDMALTYGNVRITTVGSDFGGITLKAAYGGLSMGIPRAQPLRVDIALSKGDIDVKGLALDKTGDKGSEGKGKLSAASQRAGSDAPLIKVTGAYTNVSLNGR